jgi:prevent-host-death family protein
MNMVSISKLKEQAPKILKSLKTGDPVVVTNHNRPVARLVAWGSNQNQTRIGFDPKVKIAADLTEPVLDSKEWGDLSLK